MKNLEISSYTFQQDLILVKDKFESPKEKNLEVLISFTFTSKVVPKNSYKPGLNILMSLKKYSLRSPVL